MSRVGRVEAVTLERVLTMRPVCFDLLGEIGVEARAAQQVLEAAEERIHGMHPFTPNSGPAIE